jgi:hypothetical protein
LHLQQIWPLGMVWADFSSAAMAVFWICRLPLQLFYYDPALRHDNRSANVPITLAFLLLCYHLRGGIRSSVLSSFTQSTRRARNPFARPEDGDARGHNHREGHRWRERSARIGCGAQ